MPFLTTQSLQQHILNVSKHSGTKPVPNRLLTLSLSILKLNSDHRARRARVKVAIAISHRSDPIVHPQPPTQSLLGLPRRFCTTPRSRYGALQARTRPSDSYRPTIFDRQAGSNRAALSLTGTVSSSTSSDYTDSETSSECWQNSAYARRMESTLWWCIESSVV